MSRRNKILSALGLFALVLAYFWGQRSNANEKIVPSTPKVDHDHNFGGDRQVIGIEFGNDTFRVGVQRNGRFEIIPDAQGRIETPSCVLYQNGLVLVGHDAMGELFQYPENTLCGIRQLIGRDFSDPQLRKDIKHLPYSVKNSNGKPVVQFLRNGAPNTFTPEEILAEGFRKLKADAEVYLDAPVRDAVITVPLQFSDKQRQATKDAGLVAGLEVWRLINEPTAAGLAHQLDERFGHTSDEALILTYDIQDTAFSVVVSALDQGIYEILTSTTTSEVGGQDLDSALLQLIIARYNDAEQRDITKDAGAMGRLHYEIQKAEVALLANKSAKIGIQPRRNVSNFTETVTPNTLHALHEQLFRRTAGLIDQALAQAKVGKKDIHHTIMTGDPARTSKLRPFLAKFLDGKEILDDFPSNEAFVRGAASTAALLSGEYEDPALPYFDVTTLSLGVGTADGTVTTMILRNSVVPTRKSRVFLTVNDNQEDVVFEIFEGVRPMIKDNKYIGMLEFGLIQREHAGIPRVEVTFELDPNFLLTVTARELGTENEMKVTLPDWRGEEHYKKVEALLLDAETNYESDVELEEAAAGSWISKPKNPFGVVAVRVI